MFMSVYNWITQNVYTNIPLKQTCMIKKKLSKILNTLNREKERCVRKLHVVVVQELAGTSKNLYQKVYDARVKLGFSWLNLLAFIFVIAAVGDIVLQTP